jgi:hypothetical protein
MTVTLHGTAMKAGMSQVRTTRQSNGRDVPA